jgi:hypothetical protein
MNREDISKVCRTYTDILVADYGRQPVPGAVIQYCNPDSFTDVYAATHNMIKMLSRQKSYLNIGTGVGILEYIASKEGFDVDTVEYIYLDVDPFYSILRRLLDVDLTYTSTDFYKGYDIRDCTKTYDTILLNRFGPLQVYCPIEDITNFFNQLKKYSNTIIFPESSVHIRNIKNICEVFDWDRIKQNKAYYIQINLK